MRRHWPTLSILVLLCGMLAAPATGQHAGLGASGQSSGIQWHQDLEAAKQLAKRTNRMVLVHFWTPSCAPCVTLDHTVFNQPSVSAALEQRFVPVKLNANENSATATGFGITRVPTDVILTADGHVVAKLISPPTPAGYVAEVMQAANAYAVTPGKAFADAAAQAPAPSQLNAAYANLPVSPTTPPVMGEQAQTAPQAGATTAQMNGAAPITNQFAVGGAASATPAPVTPQEAGASVGSAFAPPPLAPAPGQVANPHFSAVAPAPQAPSAATPPPVNVAANTGAAHNASQQPNGATPVGFDGYCPVSMRNHWKWVKGDPRWNVVHRGRTYHFAGQAELKQFQIDPDRYSPALSGMDPVMAIDHQQQVPGKREHSIDYDNLFYMFSSEATLAQFTANPERYAVGVRQAMGIPRGRLVR